MNKTRRKNIEKKCQIAKKMVDSGAGRFSGQKVKEWAIFNRDDLKYESGLKIFSQIKARSSF